MRADVDQPLESGSVVTVFDEKGSVVKDESQVHDAAAIKNLEEQAAANIPASPVSRIQIQSRRSGDRRISHSK